MTKEVNRNYKDTVFRMLFGDPGNALSLYNSLNGTNYTDETLLEYNTLQNAIYMNVKNDISFLIAHRMNLYEHQSTLNPNMPVRDLIYMAELLQAYFKNSSIYSTKLQKIPTPSFIMFYNGTRDMPAQMTLRLSDAFEVPIDDPALELKVTVLNINAGYNEELKEKCPVLREYMIYINKVREYAAQMELKDAVAKAVEECIREGILKDFLKRQKAEVIMLSIYEYDEEREMKLIRADEREFGREQGLEQGLEQGVAQGARAMIEVCKEFGSSREETISKIAEKLQISTEKASFYVEAYWNEESERDS